MKPLVTSSLLLGFGAIALGQTAANVTATDYARAEKFLSQAANPLVIGGTVNATWLPDDRFTYRSVVDGGTEFFIVDPVKKTRAHAFDHAKLAAALSKAAGKPFEPLKLPFQTIEFAADGKTVAFDADRKRWSCDVLGSSCAPAGDAQNPGTPAPGASPSPAPPPIVKSPDGKSGVFVKDWNLWFRDLATGQEKALTTDGTPNFGYATDNAGWASSNRAIVLWSPDSKKVATFQQDERKVGDMHLVETKARPILKSWKYPLPGDADVAMLHRVVIEVDSGKTVRFQMAPDFHRAMLGDDFDLDDVKWSPDATQLAFVSTSRDHKKATVRVANALTGVVRDVFEETEKTHYESRIGLRVLWATNEVLWYSQRDDWGHLYLYDLKTGALKNRVTSGPGPVGSLIHLDEKTRTVFIYRYGSEAGRDPYFRHAYRVGLDGKGYALLTPEDGDHAFQVSPSGKFFIDSFSTCERPPVVLLRDPQGRQVMPIETADISKLIASGWKAPMPITVKARDGKTDLYGMLFRPTNFDASKKYPIINQAYPGPQTGSVGGRAFAAARGDKQALAELGFIVVSIDGMGTPDRSKSFHDAYYGAMGRDNTLPDQVAGMKDLAARFPWIDINRAAIWGHSGGGFIAADAMFRYPDFFKVGISESGNHDQRAYEDDWGERYQGLLVKQEKGDNYEIEANQTVAKDLKGKLFLLHGMMDDNVPPYNTYLVMDALIKANKDFDLLLLPYQRHGYGSDSAYVMRRRWDYFVKHLLGVEPPKEYKMTPPPTPQRPS